MVSYYKSYCLISLTFVIFDPQKGLNNNNIFYNGFQDFYEH
jgi:hypothetical protein